MESICTKHHTTHPTHKRRWSWSRSRRRLSVVSHSRDDSNAKIQNYRSKDRGTEARRPKDEWRQSHAAGALDPWTIAGPSVGGTQKSRFPGVRANLGEGDGPARSVPRPLLARFWVRTTLHSAHTHNCTNCTKAPSTTCTTARAAGLAPTTPTRHAPGPCRYGELQSVQWQ